MKRQEESRQQRISKAKDNLAAAEAELANLPPYEPPKHKMVGLALFNDGNSIANLQWYMAKLGDLFSYSITIC